MILLGGSDKKKQQAAIAQGKAAWAAWKQQKAVKKEGAPWH